MRQSSPPASGAQAGHEPRSSLGSRALIVVQRALPQHALSRAMHRIARSRSRLVRNALIGTFVRGFRPEMDGACEPDPLRYETFNAFFTRPLRPEVRPIDPDPRAVVSPVDGLVSQIGYLDGLAMLQAKGRTYGLDALLPGHRRWIERFTGGAFATLYLAPRNYHRVHMPLGGELRAAWYAPGRLYSVNAATTRAIPGLFTLNERVTCAFESQDGLSFALVLVGALLVGSIATRWHGDVTPRSPRAALELPVPDPARPLAKGAEMGRFNMGSTVIVLFPPGRLTWREELAPGGVVRMGQRLALLGGT